MITSVGTFMVKLIDEIMQIASEIRKIIEYGTKAPSGHNTQPWKFRFSENEIQIHPDFKRALPIVDPDNHALYISLGCAAENIILASRNIGYNTDLNIEKGTDGVNFISIKVQRDSAAQKDDLFEYIEKRQVTRNAYDDTSIVSKDLKQLIDAAEFEGVHIRSFSTQEEINQLAPFIIQGSNLQFQKKAFVDELVSWIRFSKKEVKEKRDGIWHASMGMPGVGRILGNLIMKKFVDAKSEAKRWKKMIRSTPTFILFLAEKDDVPHWVNTGRAFQRFGLMATKLQINHAHVNMPCEEIEVRKKMALALGIKKEHPLLLVRLGYSERMPYSYRRPVEEVFG